MKDTIPQTIIRFVESQKEASKTAICDHVRDLHGSTGDCVARRMREMVAEGILIQEKKEYEGKKYFSYRIKPLEAKSPQKQALDNIYNQWIDMKKHECHKPYIPQEEKLNL